ncbi:MAG: hypothetical protein OQK67_00075 [Chlorobium sp.]|nr:hypothetical protein [Chlorobium sp.]MCW8819822.1 hypothetical protein [Ignavibacteriaceae bacterium]
MKKRSRFNRKRRFDDDLSTEELMELSGRIRYAGNPEHKRNPGDFGLNPAFNPRPDKSLCDDVGIFNKADAEGLLKEGARLGLVSKNRRGEWPQNIWAVTSEGQPLEAQLENKEKGTYHGYPMPVSDRFAQAVLGRWRSDIDGTS